ncbi:MAG: eukaryotic-like serine/threonine-protein kinase, partial [Acidimicrobiaceae bacterium]|nr:eukaryotic-like serine/threonine-protein kinase [Acidimicrobiaceae bacterium]
MIIEIDPDRAEFRKRAEDSAEVARLGREAVVLAAARHPGVVQLLGWEGTTLRLRLVDGVPMTSPVTAGPAVAAATTLADLHEIGVVHGAITAEHILVDRHGDPVLCGFGQARTGVRPGGPETADDVAALAAVLGARTDSIAQRAVLARAAAPGRRRPPTARQLAHLLASPPAAGGPTSSSRRRKIRAPGALIGAAALVLIAGGATGARALAAHRHPAGAACPAADRGCRPLAHPAGALSIEQGGRRYRIGQPDDVVVLGRWNCGAVHAALLQPGSGTVWVFDQWASGTARLVTHVP